MDLKNLNKADKKFLTLLGEVFIERGIDIVENELIAAVAEKISEDKLHVVVTDVVSLPKKYFDSVSEVLDKMKALGEEYQSSTDNLSRLEEIKKEMNGWLQNFAELFSTVKALKGTNHVYLENAVKKIKADAMEQLLEQGLKITAAEKLIYNSEYFEAHMQVANKLIKYCVNMELMYEHYTTTLSCITQSISILGKEYNSQKMSN